MLFIFELSNKSGGLDLWILSLANSLISVFKSSKVTGIFALHKCAAIPLPIVPEPITTTFLICIRFKNWKTIYNKKNELSKWITY